MIEVAIVSLEQALVADGDEIPAGSADPGVPAAARRPRTWARAAPRPRRAPVAAARPGGGPVIDAKLVEIAAQYDAMQRRALQPETASDPAALKRLGKELAQLEPVVAAWRELLRRPQGAGRGPRDARLGRRGDARPGPGRGPPPRGARDRSCSNGSASCCSRATPTTRRTSSSRSGPAPAATRPSSSRRSCCGCTCATPSGTACRPRS